MKSKLKKDALMDSNEDGVLSVEASLVLPIYILFLLTFAFLINAAVYNNENLFVITKDLLDKNENINYTKIKQRIKNYNKYIDKDENNIRINYSYIYSSPLIYIDDIKINKTISSKRMNNGLSILDYGLVSEYIKNDYDVWLLSNIKRGKDINELLDGDSAFDGSNIDRIYNGYLVSIVSLDFRKKSYDNEFAIINKLKNDVDRLNNFLEGYVNKTYISKDDYNAKMLNIVIPTKDFDSNVQRQLSIVKNYCNNKKIQFKITVVE